MAWALSPWNLPANTRSDEVEEKRMSLERILSILIFLAANSFAQTGQIKLYVDEATRDAPNGRRAIVNQKLDAVINDSITISITTDPEGFCTIANLPKGKYKIKIVRADCAATEVRDVIINDGKIAYVSLRLTCAAYLNSLTKKEKKKLGYK